MTEKVGVTILYEENIEKIFKMDIIEKKRIGSNIFKRVSTRKGGSNMTTMRVPTKKQQKELSGKVTTFNLNTIIPYSEFKEKSEEDQVILMKHWRENFASTEIMKSMKIGRTHFYNLLRQLGIEIKEFSINNSPSDRKRLDDSEIERILNDKDNFYDFDLFKKLVSEQQNILFEEYFNRANKVTAELLREWEGSNSGYLYYVKSRVDKIKKREAEEQKAIAIEPKSENTPSEPLEEVVASLETPVVETITETQIVPSESHSEALEGKHKLDVSMSSDSQNSFAFSLKGLYDKGTILRRMKLILEEIEDSEELLTVNIDIKA